jgi:hypothetical protein
LSKFCEKFLDPADLTNAPLLKDGQMCMMSAKLVML